VDSEVAEEKEVVDLETVEGEDQDQDLEVVPDLVLDHVPQVILGLLVPDLLLQRKETDRNLRGQIVRKLEEETLDQKVDLPQDLALVKVVVWYWFVACAKKNRCCSRLRCIFSRNLTKNTKIIFDSTPVV
jgi:hypothetical protein